MTRIVLEAASNHEGDIGRAVEMVRVAAQLGADMIKFQSYRAENLGSQVPEEERRRRARLALSDDDHWTLVEACRTHGIPFLTTCFDRGRVPFLKQLGLTRVKIASPDCGAISMLEDLAEFIDEFIISTGMSYEREVDAALRALEGKQVALLHCVSLYPTAPAEAHLKRIEWLRGKHPRVGYSDHTLGVEIAKIAVARRVDLVEKHWTLDKSLPDYGHTFSIDVEEARELIAFRDLVALADGEAYADLQEREKPAREKFVGIWGDNR